MDDLTRCLYEFVCEKRMGSLSGDEEYAEAVRGVKLQWDKLASYLDEQQQLELHTLVDTLTAQGSITNEHLFQAALSLSRELRGLVRG